MPRAGLSRAAVVDLALAELDATGGEPLALGAIAARAGVRTPSLYKHVEGLGELEALVGARITNDLADALERSLGERSGAAAAADFLRAYREFARAHPARYRALPVRPVGHPALEAAGERLMTIARRAVDGSHGDDAVHALRGLRAAAHGFASLEAAGGFGLDADLEVSFALLVDRLTR